jgi:hypothetical protein
MKMQNVASMTAYNRCFLDWLVETDFRHMGYSQRQTAAKVASKQVAGDDMVAPELRVLPTPEHLTT